MNQWFLFFFSSFQWYLAPLLMKVSSLLPVLASIICIVGFLFVGISYACLSSVVFCAYFPYPSWFLCCEMIWNEMWSILFPFSNVLFVFSYFTNPISSKNTSFLPVQAWCALACVFVGLCVSLWVSLCLGCGYFLIIVVIELFFLLNLQQLRGFLLSDLKCKWVLFYLSVLSIQPLGRVIWAEIRLSWRVGEREKTEWFYFCSTFNLKISLLWPLHGLLSSQFLSKAGGSAEKSFPLFENLQAFLITPP